jgi:signal transduction histidine kinase
LKESAQVSNFTLLLTIAVVLALALAVSLFIYIYIKRKNEYRAQILDMHVQHEKIILQSQLEIQEQTLKQIGRDLHDDVGMLASLIRIKINIIEPEKVEEAKQKIKELDELCNMFSQKLRAVTHSLYRTPMHASGFVEFIRMALDQIVDTWKLKVNLDIQGTEYRFRNDHETIIYRVCQEAFNNVVSHADATRIDVKLDFTSPSLDISITDDGKGFNVDEVSEAHQKTKGTGLSNMRNRCKLINAKMDLVSSPGNGTCIHIHMPVDKSVQIK